MESDARHLRFQGYDTDKTKLAINGPESVAALTEWFSLLPADVKYEDIAAVQSGAPGNQYGAWMAGIRGMEEDDYWMFLAIDKYAPDMDYFVNYLPTMNGTAEEQRATRVGCGIWPSPRAQLIRNKPGARLNTVIMIRPKCWPYHQLAEQNQRLPCLRETHD